MYEATFGAASAAASASRAASTTGSRAASSAAEVARLRGIVRNAPKQRGTPRLKLRIKTIIEWGDPKNMDKALRLVPQLKHRLKDLIDMRTVKQVAVRNNVEMSAWLLKNVKSKDVLRNTLDGLIEGNHHTSVGRVFEKVKVQELYAPFAILKEAFESALSNGKTDFIPEITKLLSKFYRDPRDLVWIKQMSIKIKESAPEPVKRDLFDKFVKSVSWDEPMLNHKFYEILEGVQDSPELATRWARELVNPQRKFKKSPAIDYAYEKAVETQNKVLQNILSPLTSNHRFNI
jgi:hypothetical protein